MSVLPIEFKTQHSSPSCGRHSVAFLQIEVNAITKAPRKLEMKHFVICNGFLVWEKEINFIIMRHSYIKTLLNWLYL